MQSAQTLIDSLEANDDKNMLVFIVKRNDKLKDHSQHSKSKGTILLLALAQRDKKLEILIPCLIHSLKYVTEVDMLTLSFVVKL